MNAENLEMQRVGLAAVLSGIMSVDCNDSEALALQMSTINTLINVIKKYPVGDHIEMEMMKNALEFADRGIAKEDALNEAKSILGGE